MARFVVAVLVVGLGIAAGTQAAGAAVRIPVKVSVTQSARAMITGDRALVLAGHATPSRVGGPIVLQERRGADRWVTIRSSTVTRNGAYRFSLSPTAGTHTMRVLRPSDGIRLSGLSRTFTVSSYPCTRASRPANGSTAWFQAPSHARSPLTTNLARLFCAAAPGSKVDIALYFLVPGNADTDPIVRALTLVHRYRGVHVRILLDGKSFVGGANPLILSRLRSFAQVRTCLNGCRSSVPGVGLMHTKFVTISDTTWSSRRDPVTVSSSANWSVSQLHQFWQSAQVFYDDARLTREHTIRFENMLSCATAGQGCGGWRPSLNGTALNATTYAQRFVSKVWVDPNLGTRSGDSGSGNSVLFAPAPAGTDPAIDEITGYACTPTHRTVRLAIFNMTNVRARAVAKALALLRTRGCDVRVVLSKPSAAASEQADLQALRDRSVPTICVNNVHDKFMLFDAVGVQDQRSQRVVVAGSANLTSTSLVYNDENTTRTSTLGATGAAATGNARMYSAYLASWNRMITHGTRCTQG